MQPLVVVRREVVPASTLSAIERRDHSTHPMLARAPALRPRYPSTGSAAANGVRGPTRGASGVSPASRPHRSRTPSRLTRPIDGWRGPTRGAWPQNGRVTAAARHAPGTPRRLDRQFGAISWQIRPFSRRTADHGQESRLRWRRAPVRAGPGLPARLPRGAAEARRSRGAWGMEAGGAGGVGKNERSRSYAVGALEL
jgi:hypothetical protein